MARHYDPFDIARKAAGKTDPIVTNYFHSSVILDRMGRVLSTGVNHFAGTSILIPEGELSRTVHSEIHALNKVGVRKLKGATIINYSKTRVATNYSRPCPNCWAILNKLGFRKAFYSIRSSIEIPIWVEEKF